MSQFDQDCITYTQEGRILQLEYAAKAVESAEYSLPHLEPSSVWSARTESCLVLKSRSSLSCLLITPTKGFTMLIEPSVWSLPGRFQMDGIWWPMLAMRPASSSRTSPSPSRAALSATGFPFTSMLILSTTPSVLSDLLKSSHPMTSSTGSSSSCSSHQATTSATPAARLAKAGKSPNPSSRSTISPSWHARRRSSTSPRCIALLI